MNELADERIGRASAVDLLEDTGGEALTTPVVDKPRSGPSLHFPLKRRFRSFEFHLKPGDHTIEESHGKISLLEANARVDNQPLNARVEAAASKAARQRPARKRTTAR